MALDDLAHARNQLLTRVTQHYAADERIAAAWLAGSSDGAWPMPGAISIFTSTSALAATLQARLSEIPTAMS